MRLVIGVRMGRLHLILLETNMRKIVAVIVGILICIPFGYGQDIAIIGDEEHPFTGLWRTDETKAPVGSHTRFDNVYLENGAIQAVKGRDRLTTTIASMPTVKGMAYYENAAGTTKKIVIKEASNVVTYETSGSGDTRASIAAGLTDEWTDFVQIGDYLYFTSSTDGIYRWTGSGTAVKLTELNVPSTVDFSAGSVAGGMTSGLDIGVSPSISIDSSCAISPATDATGCIILTGNDDGGENVTADTGTLEQPATTATYNYKITKYSTLLGIETEPSASDSATLSGATTFTWAGTSCSACDITSPYADYSSACCSGIDYVVGAAQTSTTGTLAAAPEAPFDSYRVYRTVAGGEDYFLLGDTKGFSAAYTDGKPDTSLGNPLDTTIDTIAPPSYRYIEEYKGVIVTAEDSTVRFTRAPVRAASSVDCYWLETDYINIGTKEPITGLHKTLDSLLVFTARAIKELTGFGATSFRLKNSVENIGAVSDETIETDINGDLIFFAGTSGVYKLRTYDQPQVDATGESVENNRRVNIQRISSPMLDKVFQGTDSQIDLDPSDYTLSHAYYDRDKDLYFLYIDDHCFLYDNKNAYWSHLPATQMVASTWRQSPSGLGVGVLADNVGFLYNNWTGYENGIHSGTVMGIASVAGSTTTLTDSSATFNTTGDGLKGQWVFLDNESNNDEGEWRQILSNTSTILTVSPVWTTNPTAGDRYYIDYVIPHFQTREYSFGKVPAKTANHFLYVVHGKSDTTQTLNIDVLSYIDQSTTATNAQTFDLSDSYVDKIGTKGFGYWHSWEGKTYIYSTSNTINPPLNILHLGLVGELIKEK